MTLKICLQKYSSTQTPYQAEHHKNKKWEEVKSNIKF